MANGTKIHIWSNGWKGMPSKMVADNPHNHRYDPAYEQALVPQTKAMNDQHIGDLMTQWFLTHKPAPAIAANPARFAEWKLMADQKARDWAVRNEPKKFLNPIFRAQGFNGIPRSPTLRRDKNGNTAVLSSSWVGDALVTANGQRVDFDLGGKTYSFSMAEIGGPAGLKACLTAPSIGRYMAQNWIGKLPSSVKNSPQYKAKSKGLK